jgi:hypothetical protein
MPIKTCIDENGKLIVKQSLATESITPKSNAIVSRPVIYNSEPQKQAYQRNKNKPGKNQEKDSFISDCSRLQRNLVKMVEELGKTYPHRMDWSRDFTINSVLGIFYTDWQAPLEPSGSADLDLVRTSYILKIYQTKAELMDLSKAFLKSNGVNEPNVIKY